MEALILIITPIICIALCMLEINMVDEQGNKRKIW